MTFASSVVMMNAMKTLTSSNSEAALLALAVEPRGLFMVVRCPEAHGAALFSKRLGVAPRKRAEEMSLVQESFAKPMLIQLPGV